MYKTNRNTFFTTSLQFDELLLSELRILSTLVIYIAYALLMLVWYCKISLALYVLYKQFKHNQSIEYIYIYTCMYNIYNNIYFRFFRIHAR